MPSVLFVVPAHGFREEELLAPLRALQEAGFATRIAAPRRTRPPGATRVSGMRGARVVAGEDLEDVSVLRFDAVVVAGGVGARDELWGNAELLHLLQRAAVERKLVVGVGLGVVPVAQAELLEGQSAACPPDRDAAAEIRRHGATCAADDLVDAGAGVITVRRPEAAREAGRRIAERLRRVLAAVDDTRPDWDVVVAGGANFDYLVRAPRLPRPGETVQGDLFQEAPGGKGANQAVAAARLGARVALIARLGADARAEEIARRLRAEGVDSRWLSRDDEVVTGVALIGVDEEGEKSIVAAPGANARLSSFDIRAAAGAIRRARVFLVQLEIPLAAVVTGVRLAHEAGARVVLDPAPPVPLPDALLGMIDLIRPNAREARVLTGVRVTDRESARRAAEKLLARGAGAAAVQAGDDGDLLVWSGGELWLPRLAVPSVDATGAGDAFAAAFAVALAEGRSYSDAGRFAGAAAALATTELGAQAGLPRRAAVLRLLALEEGEVSWPGDEHILY